MDQNSLWVIEWTATSGTGNIERFPLPNCFLTRADARKECNEYRVRYAYQHEFQFRVKQYIRKS